MRRSCAACKNDDATGSLFILGRSRLIISGAAVCRKPHGAAASFPLAGFPAAAFSDAPAFSGGASLQLVPSGFSAI